MSISVVGSAVELEKYREQWDLLAAEALQQNVFYESWMLLPALRQLAGEGVSVVLVWDPENSQRLLGLFPLQQLSRFKRFLPVAHWSSWRHPYCYLGIPLVHRDAVQCCLTLFFAWCDQAGGLSVTFSHVYEDALYSELQVFIASSRRRLNIFDQHERAWLESQQPGDEYLDTFIRKKKRKEYARLMRRFEDLGPVEFQQFDPTRHDLKLWLEHFFRLEQQGWKGDEGTAIALHDGEKVFVAEVVQAAVGLQRVQIFQLCLNEVPVASLMLFLVRSGGYAFKIAYDETFGQYSPGVLLMLDVTRSWLDHRSGAWIDSCAAPGHPMIDHIWRQRKRVLSPQVSLQHVLARPVFAAIKIIKNIRSHFKQRT